MGSHGLHKSFPILFNSAYNYGIFVIKSLEVSTTLTPCSYKDKKLTKQITNAYQNHQQEVEPHFQHLFEKPNPTLLKHTVPYLHTWLLHYDIARREWKWLHPIASNPNSSSHRLIQPHRQRKNTSKAHQRMKHHNRTDRIITGRKRPPNPFVRAQWLTTHSFTSHFNIYTFLYIFWYIFITYYIFYFLILASSAKGRSGI